MLSLTTLYNPYLLLKFNSHINVEFVASIESVKYLYKYVYKGHDCADVESTVGTRDVNESGRPTINWDEISTFLDTRYISAPEACYRIFRFPLSHRSHPVYRLAVHLPSQQSIFFQPGSEESAIVNATSRDTTLTAWFKLNVNHAPAREFFYRDVPHHFVSNKKSTKWTPRKKRARIIGRIYLVGVRDVERFCHRLLLIDVKGARVLNI